MLNEAELEGLCGVLPGVVVCVVVIFDVIVEEVEVVYEGGVVISDVVEGNGEVVCGDVVVVERQLKLSQLIMLPP